MRARGWLPIAGVLVSATMGPAMLSGTIAAAADGVLAPATASETSVRLDPPPRTFSVAATGDILTESAVLDAAAVRAGPGQRYDFAPLFSPVAPILRGADLAICHMETPIADPGGSSGVVGR